MATPEPALPMRRGRHARPTAARSASAVPEAASAGASAVPEAAPDDRQFVVALARGLELLAAFKAKDAPLGNRDLAERTGMPAATVSRLTHTLTQLGYLRFDPRHETYDLGGSTLALGHLALARLDLRRVAIEPMQQLAQRSNANVGLGMPERLDMLYAATCEGPGPVGLRLFPGTRIPIATSAMGRAYVAGLPGEAREALLTKLAAHHASDWPRLRRGIDLAAREVSAHGFCCSLGDWQDDIHGVAAPLVEPATGRVFALNLGGPAYMLPAKAMRAEHGPRLVAMRDEILARLGRRPGATA